MGLEFRTVAPGSNGNVHVRMDRTHNAAGEAVKVSLPYFEGIQPLFAERTSREGTAGSPDRAHRR